MLSRSFWHISTRLVSFINLVKGLTVVNSHFSLIPSSRQQQKDQGIFPRRLQFQGGTGRNECWKRKKINPIALLWWDETAAPHKGLKNLDVLSKVWNLRHCCLLFLFKKNENMFFRADRIKQELQRRHRLWSQGFCTCFENHKQHMASPLGVAKSYTMYH